ncbi:branched-chain amino acid aminotransferase II [Tothia fuscella]|uniref:Branched-chain-amino-acid aminotransferase n=1 Tax=Tothia fuscella TaxID=1048955 RepID=A0A9P4NGW2_9PEZI|nr:branched-chain amino acid aminotransferase II [Tothia fuscella]
MAPSAIPIPSTTSSLEKEGIARSLEKTAPSFTNGSTNGITSSDSTLPELDASSLKTTLTQNPQPVPLPDSPEVLAQKTCTDHMITCSWTLTTGWQTPELKPYGPLTLMPTASVLHYATECFEGMKLYRGYDGRLRLFRPQLNCARMLLSSARIALPGFNPDELLKLIVKLCATDGEKWLPKERPGSFLYIRPTMIANDPALGVQKPKEALLYIILACFPRMDKGQEGMKLLASKDDMVRAWPGGFGFAKVGANYGPTLICQGEARARGYDQILWLFGPESSVTEAGASNFFIVWKTRVGQTQLVTAPLSERIILDGVTRRSVLQLARERLSGSDDNVEVVERKFNFSEMLEAYDEGRLLECFVAGTAFFISGVGEIGWKDRSLTFKLNEDGCGRYAGLIKASLKNIMYGKQAHEWGYVVEEN